MPLLRVNIINKGKKINLNLFYENYSIYFLFLFLRNIDYEK